MQKKSTNEAVQIRRQDLTRSAPDSDTAVSASHNEYHVGHLVGLVMVERTEDGYVQRSIKRLVPGCEKFFLLLLNFSAWPCLAVT